MLYLNGCFWISKITQEWFLASKFFGLYTLNDHSVEDHKCEFVRSMIHAVTVWGSYDKGGRTARGHRTWQGRTVVRAACPARRGSPLMGRRMAGVLRALAAFWTLLPSAQARLARGVMIVFHKSCLCVVLTFKVLCWWSQPSLGLLKLSIQQQLCEYRLCIWPSVFLLDLSAALITIT